MPKGVKVKLPPVSQPTAVYLTAVVVGAGIAGAAIRGTLTLDAVCPPLAAGPAADASAGKRA